MYFLKQCARELDEGTPALEVLEKMRNRFTTPGCMKVKTCLIRSMCKPSSEFVTRLNDALSAIEGEDERERIRSVVVSCASSSRKRTGDSVADEILGKLPPYRPKNVREFHISGEETMQCKTRARLSRLSKNHKKTCVDGVKVLEIARRELCEATTVSDLAFSLMIVTGRRQCELLSGHSDFNKVAESPYAAHFTGQAKRKKNENAPHTYVIPLLETYDLVYGAYLRLRRMQNNVTLTKKETSLKYQSLLSRRLVSRNDPLSDAKCCHGFRGAYACMALRAFSWGSRTDSFVTMCILGHRDLEESLVYTTFDVGDDFVVVHGRTLGKGLLTEPLQKTFSNLEEYQHQSL